MTDPIRVVVADDHPLFLEGVVTTINGCPDLHVAGQAKDAAGALQLVKQHLPEVVLLDIGMPGGGLQAAREIATACPATKIVMLTASEDEDDLIAARRVGVAGYALKGISARTLVGVLRAVAAGDVYVAPELAWRMLGERTKPREAGLLDELTGREREVLELVAVGLSNQEIGVRLGLAERTIKHYMTNVLAKLQLRSRVEVALLAQEAGLTRPPHRQAGDATLPAARIGLVGSHSR